MIVIANIVQRLARSFPNLKRELRMAHVKKTPEELVKSSLLFSLYISVGVIIILFFLFLKLEIPLVFVIPAFPLLFIITLFYLLQTPKGRIRKHERELNKEVLFAGRYLLVKMESGSPLFNSLIDASKSYGVCGSFFKEIVDEINTGTPIEQALENAREYCPSQQFKRILWQIVTALKTGADVTDALRVTLQEITDEQIIEIQSYGKKLNSISLFYMVLACVLPSLGITLILILLSFLQLQLGMLHLFSVLFFVAVVQLAFILLIKAVRPMVEL